LPGLAEKFSRSWQHCWHFILVGSQLCMLLEGLQWALTMHVNIIRNQRMINYHDAASAKRPRRCSEKMFKETRIDMIDIK
jgi:hypothetical protein